MKLLPSDPEGDDSRGQRLLAQKEAEDLGRLSADQVQNQTNPRQQSDTGGLSSSVRGRTRTRGINYLMILVLTRLHQKCNSCRPDVCSWMKSQ